MAAVNANEAFCLLVLVDNALTKSDRLMRDPATKHIGEIQRDILKPIAAKLRKIKDGDK